jgi:hypothetical protein
MENATGAGGMVAPFGSWRSPIDSDLIATETTKLIDVLVDGEDIYWIESRPKEGGRFVLVRHVSGGKDHDLTPAPFNARSRVHEYGGGAVLVDRGVVFFTNFADQKLYRQDQDGIPRPLSQASHCRYADATVDATRNRLICVREDHGRADGAVINSIVAIAFDGIKEQQVLLQGHDFYSNPRVSPDGKRLTWLAWNHPNMPWFGTELWVGMISETGEIQAPVRVAGSADESIFQPEWSPGGTLYFVSDRTGWWNLYRYRGERVDAVLVKNAEFGEPQWVFGMANTVFSPTAASFAVTGKPAAAISRYFRILPHNSFR